MSPIPTATTIARSRRAQPQGRLLRCDGRRDHEQRRRAEDERGPPEVDLARGVHRREVAAESDRGEQREPDPGRDAPRSFLRLERREHDADSAHAMPAICVAEGLSPVANPKTTGTIAEMPAIGATTLIAPAAIPR